MYVSGSLQLTQSSALPGCTVSWLSGFMMQRSHPVLVLQMHMILSGYNESSVSHIWHYVIFFPQYYDEDKHAGG